MMDASIIVVYLILSIALSSIPLMESRAQPQFQDDDSLPQQQQLQFYNPSTAPSPSFPSPLAPALFVIGDSSVDSGTNNFLGTFARADHPPYGRDFDTHQPTGRFSNGRIPVDYLGNN